MPSSPDCGCRWNNKVAHAVFDEVAEKKGKEVALQNLRQDIKSWIREREGKVFSWTLRVETTGLVAENGKSLEQMTKNVFEGPNSDSVDASVKETARFYDLPTLQRVQELALKGEETIIHPEHYQDDQGNMMVRYFDVLSRDKRDPQLYHGSRIDLGKNFAIDEAKKRISCVASTDDRVIFHRTPQEKAFVLSVQKSPEEIKQKITDAIIIPYLAERSIQRSTALTDVRQPAIYRRVERADVPIVGNAGSFRQEQSQIRTTTQVLTHEVEQTSARVLSDVAKTMEHASAVALTSLQKVVKQERARMPASLSNTVRVISENNTLKPFKENALMRHQKKQKNVEQLTIYQQPKRTLQRESIQPKKLMNGESVQQVKKEGKRNKRIRRLRRMSQAHEFLLTVPKKKEFKQWKKEEKKQITASRVEHVTKKLSAKKEKTILVEQPEKKRRRKERLLFFVLTKLARRIAHVAHKNILQKDRIVSFGRRYPVLEHRRNFESIIELKKEEKKLQKKESRRKEKEKILHFSFAWTLWLLLKPSAPKESSSSMKPKEKYSHISIYRYMRTAETTREVLVQKEPTPWIFFAIIWYLAMIRESGLAGFYFAGQGVQQVQKKKQTKKICVQNPLVIPPQGIIFAFGL